ncbi:MAG: transcriptional repressor [Pseudomonadota bacterium]
MAARHPTSYRPVTPVRDLLARSGARITPARETVLAILLEAPRALSHLEVEQAARQRGLTADRVTLYRVLDWLVGQGLAHRIEGQDRVRRFNAEAAVEHAHAHFHCTRCGQVFCLEQPLPRHKPQLPEGFRFEGMELTIRGLCPTCSTQT